jgi:hypothetical protein
VNYQPTGARLRSNRRACPATLCVVRVFVDNNNLAIPVLTQHQASRILQNSSSRNVQSTSLSLPRPVANHVSFPLTPPKIPSHPSLQSIGSSLLSSSIRAIAPFSLAAIHFSVQATKKKVPVRSFAQSRLDCQTNWRRPTSRDLNCVPTDKPNPTKLIRYNFSSNFASLLLQPTLFPFPSLSHTLSIFIDRGKEVLDN